jgi:RNA polymerase sigma factor (sigma-70 family)
VIAAVPALHSADCAGPRTRSSPPVYVDLDVECAMRAARSITRQLMRRGLLRAGDRDDFIGEMLLGLVERWPLYRPERASAGTFMSVVMRTRAVQLVRASRAAKRGGDRCRSATDLRISDMDSMHSEADTDEVERLALKEHVRCRIHKMPPPLRQVCGVLMTEPASSAARELSISRCRLRLHLREARAHLEQGGFMEPPR